MVHCPYGVFIGMLEPVNPVLGSCIANHLGVFIAGSVVLFVEGMVKVMSLGELVDFVGKLTYFGAFLLEVRGPPSFLVQGWFGEWDVFVDNSVDGVFEVFEGCLEFVDGVEGVRNGEFVEFDFHILDKIAPFYFSPGVLKGWGGL